MTDPERMREADWCGGCGLRLRDDTPGQVWTGHIHTPVSAEMMADAATVWSVGRAAGQNSAALRRIEDAGVTRQAVEMFIREGKEGERDGEAAQRP